MKSTAVKIVNIYTLFLMVVFPLFMTDSYFNIQESKMYCFLYSTMAAAGLILTIAVVGRLKGVSWDNNAEKGSFRSRFKKSMMPADWFAALFLIVVLLSTACSEWKYEAFWGNMGRWQGCFLLSWYVVAYALISRFYRPKQWHMDLFIAAGLVVCVWGVLDCFWKSPIGWQLERGAVNEKALDFSSTIGNVNVLTAVEGMYLMAASAMFIGVERVSGPVEGATTKVKPVYAARLALYYITACAAFMGLVCGCSDNALISAAAAICFLPFLAFRSMKGIVRYAALLAGYIGTMLLTGYIGHREGQKVVIRWKWGKLLEMSMEQQELIRKLLIAALVLLAILSAIYVLSMKKKAPADAVTVSETPWKGSKPLRILWACLGVLAACVLIWVFYDANHGGHPELYAPYRKFIIFDDAWGTHRGYNWRLAMKYIKDFPLYKKLLGSGPETYGIYTHVYDHYAMMDKFAETYDSPHNEWLQYLFTTGILGFVGYYGMVKCALWSGFGIGRKTVKEGAGYAGIALMGAAFAYALQAYTLQSFVNISIPVIVPMVFLSLGVCVAVGRQFVHE